MKTVTAGPAECYPFPTQAHYGLAQELHGQAPPEVLAPFMERIHSPGVIQDRQALNETLIGNRLESLVPDINDFVDTLTITEGETTILGIYDCVMRSAAQRAEQVIEAIPDDVPSEKRLLVAGFIAGNMVYADRKRKTGRPYDSHPREVTANLFAALQTVQLDHPGNIPDQRMDRILFVAYNHDAPEMSLPIGKFYHTSTHAFVMTPLVGNLIFNQLGLSGGEDVANSLRRLTHMRHPERWTHSTYRDYVRAMLDDPEAVAVKLSDIDHNLDKERKPLPANPLKFPRAAIKRARKHQDYRWGKNALVDAASSYTGAEGLWIPRLPQLLGATSMAEDMPRLVVELEEYAETTLFWP